MRSLRAFLYFTLGVMIALVWGIQSASAQGVVYNSPSGPIPTEVVGPFSNWSAGMRAGAAAATAVGVTVAASGIAQTTLSNGARIGTTIAVDGVIQRSKIAAAAAAFSRWGRYTNPAILAGSAVYAVYKESGYQTCPPPDFFCKPLVSAEPVPGVMGYRYHNQTSYSSTRQAACSALSASIAAIPSNAAYTIGPGTIVGTNCQIRWTQKDTPSNTGLFDYPEQISITCPSGMSPSGTMCIWASGAPPVGSGGGSYTDAELEQAFNEKMASDPAFHKKYWDAVISDADRNANYKAPPTGELVPPDTPITARPIQSTTTPPVEISKETIQNADGTTSTRTTKAETTVQPKVEGTTVADARVTASSTTKYTTTTVNNTTNNTTTNTSTVTNNAPTEAPKRDDSFVDSGMPDVPSLYTQKYPDGIAGAWRDHKPDLSSTSFFAGVKGMFPEFGGGSCPSFALPLTIGSLLGAGTVPFNVPCSIYGFIGLVMLITAAFTARKIIF